MISVIKQLPFRCERTDPELLIRVRDTRNKIKKRPRHLWDARDAFATILRKILSHKIILKQLLYLFFLLFSLIKKEQFLNAIVTATAQAVS